MNKYKKLRDIIINKKKLDLAKQEQVPYVGTDNLEREFLIEVLASHFEGRLLNIEYKDLKEFWDFTTNEDVNISNIERFKSIINKEIFKQYPKFKVLDINKHNLNDIEIDYLIKWYKKTNGNKIRIKSLKKGYTKTLKNTR